MINANDMKEFEKQFKDFKIEEMPIPGFDSPGTTETSQTSNADGQEAMLALMGDILATLTSIDEYIRQ